MSDGVPRHVTLSLRDEKIEREKKNKQHFMHRRPSIGANLTTQPINS